MEMGAYKKVFRTFFIWKQGVQREREQGTDRMKRRLYRSYSLFNSMH